MNRHLSDFRPYYKGHRPAGSEYEVRFNRHAEEDDRGGHVAWEVWHWPTETVESDWFTATDAYNECLRLTNEVRQ
jgi:hypothetical protein